MKKRYMKPHTALVEVAADRLMDEAAPLTGSAGKMVKNGQGEKQWESHDSYFNYGGVVTDTDEDGGDAKGHSAWSSWDD